MTPTQRAAAERIIKALQNLGNEEEEAAALLRDLVEEDEAGCALQAETKQEPQGEPVAGWLEAAVAWEVCASIHSSFAKGKDALFTTRHADFVKHADAARAKALAKT